MLILITYLGIRYLFLMLCLNFSLSYQSPACYIQKSISWMDDKTLLICFNDFIFVFLNYAKVVFGIYYVLFKVRNVIYFTCRKQTDVMKKLIKKEAINGSKSSIL